MFLREYQQQLINDLRRSFLTSHKRPICVAGCGAGKTVLACFMCANHKGTVWFLVHRRELIEQTHRTFEKMGLNYDNVVIAMVQTITRHISDYPKPSLIIMDEAHHSLANQWKHIIDTYPDVKVVGLTATPSRLDGKPLGEIYDDLIFAPNVSYLISHNYLSPYEYYAPRINLVEAEWEIKGSDYDMTSVSNSFDKSAIYGDILKYIRTDARTIIYAPSIITSKKFVEAINQHYGYIASHIDGDTPKNEREQIMNDFRFGNIKVMSNVDLFGEGIDVPDCNTVILARPTLSLTLYIQQAMRCMRYQPNKTAYIYDLVGNVFRHGSIEDDFNWSLTKKLQKPKKDTFETKVRECKNCFRVYKGTKPICPYCGFNNGKTRKEIEIEQQAELQRIEAIQKRDLRKEVGMARTYEQLLKIERMRHYKKGWAYRVFMSRKKI